MPFPDKDTVIRRAIDAHGGIDKIIAAADADIAEFSALWDQDAERIGRVLRAHLTVEFFLTRYIEYKNPMLPPLTDARVTFNQKIALLPPNDRMSAALMPGIRRLNQVRNRLAHNLHIEITLDDVNAFLGVDIFRAMRAESAKRFGPPSDDSLAVLEAFAKFAAGMLQAGSAKNSAIWAAAFRDEGPSDLRAEAK
jgi:hypothetical protein